jgi:tRNA (Thr-GGU) A37 N-methylase
LLGTEGNVLSVENVDILGGQSFLEIKPYVPECDEHPAA